MPLMVVEGLLVLAVLVCWVWIAWRTTQQIVRLRRRRGLGTDVWGAFAVSLLLRPVFRRQLPRRRRRR